MTVLKGLGQDTNDSLVLWYKLIGNETSWHDGYRMPQKQIVSFWPQNVCTDKRQHVIALYISFLSVI